MSLVCFESRWILGLTIGETRSQWMFAALSGSVLAMTRMPLTVTKENHMFDWKQFIINQILMATIAFTLLVYPHLLATMLRAL